MYDLSLIRACWEEVDLDAIAHNVREIRQATDPKALLTAVVKANAYGHGAVTVAPVMLAAGADRLAVATLEEAIELREAGIEAPILILGYTDPARAATLLDYDIEQVVYDPILARALSEAAQASGKEAKIHIIVDTGMGRIGYLPVPESLDQIETILAFPGLVFQGLMSHFATADEEDPTYTHEQHRRIMFFVDGLAERGLVAKITHIGNSATITDFPEYHHDMCRAGIILYGAFPTSEIVENVVNTEAVNLRPTMCWKCRVVHIKEIEDGESVGYGRRYRAKGRRKIATIPVGYSDGFCRRLSNRADVLIGGRRCRVAGNICMDQAMIDVTDVPDVAVGDEVVLIGRQGDETITTEEMAVLLETINYEVFCAIARRVPRVYFQGGRPVKIVDYLT